MKHSSTDRLSDKAVQEMEKSELAHNDIRRTPRWIRAVTWIVRLLVGGVFIFSGFTKGIDPWGTIYKMSDYFGALGIGLWPALTVAAAFMLSIAEFLCGVFIVTGSFRRFSPWFAALFMVVMLPLTLWIALENPVEDCGCFGDALKISNWATFRKNLVISVGVVWLIIYNRKTGWLFCPALQWLGVVASGVYLTVLALVGYNYQPLIDFRPYPEGTPLLADTEEESEFIFIYERDGERREFSETDALPDEADGWTFVDRIEKKAASPVASSERKDSEFRVWDTAGEQDVTEDVLGVADQLLVLVPDLSEMSASYIWKLNSLQEWSAAHDVEMMMILSGSQEEIAEWEDLAMASYPVYSADDTAIKELARGNPALVFMRNDTIRWKGSLSTIAAENIEGTGKDVFDDPMQFAIDSRRMLLNITAIYLAVMAALCFLSFSPSYARIFNMSRLGGGKRHS